ncbi:Quino protein alcohol dehydrogenase-like protein [Echria macrotheca]|uniref:Quino protein alcohol dehydrogenase-like protein n=1 Tax=Echria macrotheca TaxID=438768 RepID=A0AAJ0B9E8_9PEZI|nr:Quino protein alcohol dehydrogenase-like protein [Echria macrotheca]
MLITFRLLATLVVASLTTTISSAADDEWSGWGANTRNNRWASSNKKITSRTISSLAPKCQIFYPKGVSATPVLKGNTVYYPTWNGLFVALDFEGCRVKWQINVTDIISAYAPITPLQATYVRPVARTSPQIDGDILYFGTLTNALVVAVDRNSGAVLATHQLNAHPLAIVTMSPTLFDNKLFVGAASVEENLSILDPDYKCCTFVGNVAALKFDKPSRKFSVVWDVPMIPAASAAAGWSGVGMWGSQPSIDSVRRQVFFASGNTYSVPDVIIDCQETTQNISAVKQGLVPDPCLPRDILQESVIALDLDLGIINWVHQLPALDAFTAACGYPGLFPQNKTACPEIPGLDYDFGMAPAFVPGSTATPYGKDIVVVGQKSGIIYAFSAQAGHLFWATQTSPGGLSGGLSWGVAADDVRAYFTAINWGGLDFTLQPSGVTVNRSAYGAVSLATGAILWETGVPGNGTSYAPPSVVGDLVLVGKTGLDPNLTQAYDTNNGSLVALDKATGQVLLEYVLDTNTHSGVAVRDDYVLLGLGYDGFEAPAPVPGSIKVMKLGK